MPECTNLYAYTEPTPTDGYPGYVSLNREPDKSVTLTVRSPGHGGTRAGTITLPEDVAAALAAALTLGGVEMVAGGLDPDVLVARFLTWPVPADVYPDGTPGQPGRTGTNLLTAAQARYMLDHVLAGELTTLPPGFEDDAYKAAHEESNRDWKDFVRGAKWAVKRLLKA